jgi:hypothetical protein
MGSMYSGRYLRVRRQTTNDVTSINIKNIDYRILPSDLWIRGGNQFFGDPLYIKATGNELLFGARQGNSISIIGNASLTWSSRNFGGKQTYFLCPKHDCGRRAAILYISNDQIACRTCSNLSYESQHENKYIRLLNRARKLRDKIGAPQQSLSALPQRPKGMHGTTYGQITFMILSTEIQALQEMKAYMKNYWGKKLQHLDQMAERSA